jgi:CelD/BcsL family acetyltransferase involved in cellulose biosynthesis
MAVQVNRPDAAEWTIRNWGQKWAGDEDGEISDTGDRLLMARFWEPRGRHATVTLMLDDRFVASAAVFVHGNDIVGLANYREPEFDKLQTGTRLLDAVHHWATDAGYDKHDFGGGHDYKKRWAPEDGSRWQFTVDGHRKGLRALAKSARARIVAAIRS